MSKLEPGGLAMLRHCVRPENNGQIVTLIQCLGVQGVQLAGGKIEDHSAWQTDFKGLDCRNIRSDGKLPAYQLFPLDNPSDDVEDESKAWLPPVPTTKKENQYV